MNVKNMSWILPMLFFSPAAWADPCGITGTLEQRIEDCGETMMKLVTIDDAGHVIKMDDMGLLWGPNLDGTFTFDRAQVACEKVTEADGYPTIAGLSEKWRLPTPEEFAHIGRKDQSYFNKNRRMSAPQKEIQGNESWKELPNMKDHFYWSPSLFDRDDAWAFFSYDGGVVFYGYRYSLYGSVRCVARR